MRIVLTGIEILQSGDSESLIHEAKLKVLRSMCFNLISSCRAAGRYSLNSDCLIIEPYFDSSSWTGLEAK